jgi:hypothetical protein
MCSLHYRRAREAGQLPPVQLEIPLKPAHSLLNIDRENSTADCSICGTGTPVRIRSGRGTECARKSRKSGGPLERRAWRLASKYGLTLEQFAAMEAEQGGCCLICKDESPQLVVDHDHETGRVRGLLCRECNLALGYLKDRPEAAVAAAEYLSR